LTPPLKAKGTVIHKVGPEPIVFDEVMGPHLKWVYTWVFPKIGGKHPKMDGENNGKPYFLMDDLGGKPTIFGNSHMG